MAHRATTRLSITGTPGKHHHFTSKSGGPHPGLFTALSITGTPGKRHTFTAKGVAVAKAYGGRQFPEKFVISQAKAQELHERITREDNELMEILAIVLELGILE